MAKSKKHNPGRPVWLTLLGLILLSALIAVLLRGTDVILFNPQGLIANEQHRLMITATLVMLEIGIPTLFIFYYFAWKYRENNDQAERDASVPHGKLFTFAIWGFPTITAILLAFMLVPATHKLVPQKHISGTGDPLVIKVVALRWKWLFIYPEQNVATVNYVNLPIHTPVQFELTADETPMSSFWIPHLGGQLYAMTGHVNRLNLIPGNLGDFEGSSAEINGAGFSGMRFNTHVSTQEEFDRWVLQTESTAKQLDTTEYANLLAPSKNNTAAFYTNPNPEIYDNILNKYVAAHSGSSHGGYSEPNAHTESKVPMEHAEH